MDTSSSSTTVTFPPTMSREDALIALWNATHAIGMGVLHSHKQPTVTDAAAHFAITTDVDYFVGKPIKTDFSTYPVLKSLEYEENAPPTVTMQRVATGDAPFIGPTEALNRSDDLCQVRLAYGTPINRHYDY